MSNQQERQEIDNWIVGFTDGEGCFSVSLFRNKTTALGWQVFPEFVITQGKKSLSALELVRDRFGCGNIYVNKRHDNHHEYIYRYCVRSLLELNEKIIPFFQEHTLRTSKQDDFLLFVEIISMMKCGEHRSQEGLRIIAEYIERMNRKKASQFLESSETTRRAPHREKRSGEDMVLGVHGNQKRNSLSGKFRPARMA